MTSMTLLNTLLVFGGERGKALAAKYAKQLRWTMKAKELNLSLLFIARR